MYVPGPKMLNPRPLLCSPSAVSWSGSAASAMGPAAPYVPPAGASASLQTISTTQTAAAAYQTQPAEEAAPPRKPDQVCQAQYFKSAMYSGPSMCLQPLIDLGGPTVAWVKDVARTAILLHMTTHGIGR